MPETLDIRKPGDAGKPSVRAVDQHSELWARIAGPFAWAIFVLLGVVIVIPFYLLWLQGGTGKERMDAILDWAKTVLPPAVGFGSAVAGYYFGTRLTGSSSDEDHTSE